MNLVSVAVRVTNLAGRVVKGLTADDFTILEDGRPQPIAYFAAENQPTSLAVLLDGSSSMSGGKNSDAKTALHRLLKASPPGSQL